MSQFSLRSLLLVALVLGGCNTADKVERVAESSIDAATFIGSAACQSCHEGVFSEWIGSHHERAMQIATADTVLGNFNDASLDYFGSATRFFTIRIFPATKSLPLWPLST